MEPMTQKHMHDILLMDLTRKVQFEDKGISVIPLETDWGCTVKFKRQDRVLPWRVTINNEGRVAVYKPQTSSLPPVSMVFAPEDAEQAKMLVIDFIQGGWL